MQSLFMVTTFALFAILIYSLCVNGRKIKDMSERKDKQISELSDEVKRKARDSSHAQSEISMLKSQINDLSARINGDRVCDGYCMSCEHVVVSVTPGRSGDFAQYECELNCMCKDFRRKTIDGNGEVRT